MLRGGGGGGGGVGTRDFKWWAGVIEWEQKSIPKKVHGPKISPENIPS